MLPFLKSVFLLFVISIISGCSSGAKFAVHEFDNSLSENKDTVVVMTSYSIWDGISRRTTLFTNGKGVTENKDTFEKKPIKRSNFQFSKEFFKLLVRTFEMYDFFSLKDKYFYDPADCPNAILDGPSYEITIKINGREKTVITGGCYGSAQVTKLIFLVKLIQFIESRETL